MLNNCAEVISKYGLVVQDGLLLLSAECALGKQGVVVDKKYYFRFSNDSANSQFQLDGGLWDSLNRVRKDNKIAVSVDLNTITEIPRGFKKYAAKMYGIDFSETILRNWREPGYVVHFDEHSVSGNPEKISLAIYPREDGVSVVYLEELNSFSGIELSMRTKFLHAEYNREDKRFSHIDGAYKTYSKESYLDRYMASPVKAKHSDLRYDKVFRFDGGSGFADWLLLVSGFFYGNRLFKELMESKLGKR